MQPFIYFNLFDLLYFPMKCSGQGSRIFWKRQWNGSKPAFFPCLT